MGNFLLMQSEPSSSSRAVATAAPMGLLLLESSCCWCQKKSSSSSSRVAAAAKMGLLLLLQELLPLPKWVLFCCFFKGSCYPSKFSSSSSPSDMIATKNHCKSSEALSLICLSHLSHLSLSNLTCDLC